MICLRREGYLIRNGLNICVSAREIIVKLGAWRFCARLRSRVKGGSLWSMERVA
jgi:hypothetical protein